MIPRMTLIQRILAWIIWKIEAKHHWGLGFDSDDLDGTKALLKDPRFSYCIQLLQDRYYIQTANKVVEE